MSSLAERIKRIAQDLGFDAAAVAPAAPAPTLDAYLAWLRLGYHGEQAYLARSDRVARRRDPQLILPGAQSMIVVGMHYWPGQLPREGEKPAYGRVSCYAQGVDYHQVMLPRLVQLHELVSAECGQPAHGRAYVDTGPILERAHAQQAGLGFIGKNTSLIQPTRGSWLFLGVLLTDSYLEPDDAPQMPTCGRCRRCLDACPTQALVGPFTLDSRRCISYLTTALKEAIPRQSRSLIGNHIFGCDICQAACPWNRFALPVAGRPPEEARPLLHLLTMAPAEFRARYGDTPIGHIGYQRFMRNVVVAAGNWAAPEAADPVIRLLQDDSAMVRAHAAWALGEVRTAAARAALERAQETERVPAVMEEIALARRECS